MMAAFDINCCDRKSIMEQGLGVSQGIIPEKSVMVRERFLNDAYSPVYSLTTDHHRRFGVIPKVRPEPMALAGRGPEIVLGRD